MVIIYWLLCIGCYLLVIIYWLLFIGCYLLVIIYWLLFIGCYLLVIIYWLLFIAIFDPLVVICATSTVPCCCYVVYIGKGSVLNGRGKYTPPPSMYLLPFLYLTVKTHALYEYGQIHRALENF